MLLKRAWRERGAGTTDSVSTGQGKRKTHGLYERELGGPELSAPGSRVQARFTSFSASAYPIHTPRAALGDTIYLKVQGLLASCTPCYDLRPSLPLGPLLCMKDSHTLGQCLINVPTRPACGCTSRQPFVAGLELDCRRASARNEEHPHWRASSRHPRLHL